MLELAEARPEDGRPERSFLAAIDEAKRQGARALHLRATLSLARLWREGGSPDRAREILNEAQGTFSEGRETPDLRAAQALLEELS